MSEIKVIRETSLGVIVGCFFNRCRVCKYFGDRFDWCARNCECDTMERYLTEEEEQEQEYYSSKRA